MILKSKKLVFLCSVVFSKLTISEALEKAETEYQDPNIPEEKKAKLPRAIAIKFLKLAINAEKLDIPLEEIDELARAVNQYAYTDKTDASILLALHKIHTSDNLQLSEKKYRTMKLICQNPSLNLREILDGNTSSYILQEKAASENTLSKIFSEFSYCYRNRLLGKHLCDLDLLNILARIYILEKVIEKISLMELFSKTLCAIADFSHIDNELLAFHYKEKSKAPLHALSWLTSDGFREILQGLSFVGRRGFVRTKGHIMDLIDCLSRIMVWEMLGASLEDVAKSIKQEVGVSRMNDPRVVAQSEILTRIQQDPNFLPQMKESFYEDMRIIGRMYKIMTTQFYIKNVVYRALTKQ